MEGLGPRPFLPARGTVRRPVALLPSSVPLYVTMANPHVVLCTGEVPPGRQGLLGGLRRGPKDAGLARDCHMSLAPWGPRGQGCGEMRRAGGEKSESGLSGVC